MQGLSGTLDPGAAWTLATLGHCSAPSFIRCLLGMMGLCSWKVGADPNLLSQRDAVTQGQQVEL